MQNNANKTISNVIWRLLERGGAQGVTFVVSIILARLLEPSVYGLIAIVTVFTSIFGVFISSGLGVSLVQKKNADELDFSTVFYTNIVFCALLYLILFFTAPFIASFYEEPQLTDVVRVLGITILISSFSNIQSSYIAKNLMFKKYFFSTLGSTVISAVVGIYMAYTGYGVWALVAQQIVSNICNVVILWFTGGWRPKLLFSFGRLKGLFSYGWKILAVGLIDTVYNDIRQLIIGKLYSSEDLAYYNKGKQFPSLIVTNFNMALDSVLFPVMSNDQDNKERIKAMTRRSIKTCTYIFAPLLLGMAACAEPIIRLLLTEKWLISVPYMSIFCITFIFYPIHTANLNAIKGMGRSDLFLKLEIVKKIVGVSALLATMFISVEAMAYSLLFTTLTSTIINAFPNKKLLGYSWFDQMKDILPNITLGFVMAVPVFFMQYLPLPTVVILALQVLTGAVIYIGLSAVFKLEIFQYLIKIIKGFFGKKKSA